MKRLLGSLSIVMLAGAVASAHAQTPAGWTADADRHQARQHYLRRVSVSVPEQVPRISVYNQDVRISYMDVAPRGTANGHTVLLLHGNNFGGFYFKAIIDALTAEGFRVIVPDQIGYGRSSKPIAPYNFNSQTRNT